MIVSWPSLKSTIDSSSLSSGGLKYSESQNQYYINYYDGSLVISAYITKTNPANADQADFETNYLPLASSGAVLRRSGVTRTDFQDAFDKELAYTVTTDFRNSGTSQINILLLRLISSRTSHSLIKNVRFGNEDGNRSILRVYSMPTIVDPGENITENNRLINKANTRSADLLCTKNDGTMDISNRGTLLNIFVGHETGQTIEVPVELKLDKPDSGVSRILFTIQNSLAATSTHIDIDWLEEPI